MIGGFKDEATRRLFEGGSVHGVGWEQVQRVAMRKILMLHAATSLRDLASPPNNRLEALRKDRVGQHSIRINDQWRVCFVWRDGGPHDVEIVDYH